MLPHIKTNRQCTAKAKSTQTRCLNPAAYGCKTCRVHGARRPESINRGKDHPNYKHGKLTQEMRDNRREASKRLHELVDLGNAIQMFFPQTKLRGRRPR